eukprot:TRINITY_DN2514_c0_g2_i1.p1 TRINITY_DN2514_c0_g2~~TRINITY_DN2514_c0_g2_i1.p1  ORF type:complete len:482 (-),score=90.54 TRINITY_DN2514_c0_g2_i1:83-1528(-)
MAKFNVVPCCVAEFVGTFMLVFTVGCNVLGGNKTWGAVSIASVLMVTIYALGGVSGANFNPAVSCALRFTGHLKDMDDSVTQLFLYIGTQLVAALCAGLAYEALFQGGFELKPKPGYTVGAVFLEFAYTFLLVFCVLNTAVSKASQEKGPRKTEYFGLTIAFSIVAGGYASAPLGAGCFNPAVAFGIFVGSSFQSFGWMLIYSAAELAGACAACCMFYQIRPEEGRKNEGPPQVYAMKSKLVAEGLGTYFLVLTVGLNVLGESPAGAFSIAAALMCMIYNLGDVSGGHFNPAVTFAVHYSKKKADMIDRNRLTAEYICAQVLGAILASFSYALVHRGATIPLGPGVGHGWVELFAAEAVFTFVLCLTVLFVACADEAPAGVFTGFAVGSCVTVGGFAVGSISGGALNPAVAIGVATVHLMSGGLFFKALIYSLAELLAAFCAIQVFEHLYIPPPKLEERAVVVPVQPLTSLIVDPVGAKEV